MTFHTWSRYKAPPLCVSACEALGGFRCKIFYLLATQIAAIHFPSSALQCGSAGVP